VNSQEAEQGKVTLGLKNQVMKVYMGCGGKAPQIIDFGT
jgi:hypothetical protein